MRNGCSSHGDSSCSFRDNNGRRQWSRVGYSHQRFGHMQDMMKTGLQLKAI